MHRPCIRSTRISGVLRPSPGRPEPRRRFLHSLRMSDMPGPLFAYGDYLQEFMLKKGLAWHYVAYDQRPEFALWEKEARAARVGLWASSNPEKPWEWRKSRRNGV